MTMQGEVVPPTVWDAGQRVPQGPKGAITTPEWLRGLAESYGDAEAVVGSGRRITYRELEQESRHLARGLLARGVAKGARIGLWLGNGPNWVIVFAAITRCGAVAVPLSTFFSDAELAGVIRHADLAGLFVQPTFLGVDQRDRLSETLPDLKTQGGPLLAVASAPYLRWVATVERSESGPIWCADRSWFDEGTSTPGFDDALLASAQQEISPDDDALMIYTSGSTAMSKGVPHTHRAIMEKTHYLREWMGLADGISSFIGSPFFWVGGLTMSLLIVLDGGGTQFCTDRFDAGEVLDLIAAERIQRAVVYPHQINAMLEHPDFDATDRTSLTDADPRLLAPGVKVTHNPDAIRIGLGMTETFGGYWWGRPEGLSASVRDRHERRPPPCEIVQPGVEVRVVDASGHLVKDGEIGEICIRGASVTRGLHKVPRHLVFDPDGWFHTGDQALVDGDRLQFKGRIGDMIKTAGANVAPSEVVVALRQIPGVSEAYVLGLPDLVRGQSVAAVIIAEKGSDLDAASLRQALRAHLSTFKVPSAFVFMDAADIPWTPSHKVKLGRLAEIVRERLAEKD
jgi:acyl-CoA synthetase (AMP-forming)/AMP-acid ligase II